ncbi:MAG TPA: ATP-dependent protease [Candidatus Acetothermia bacterium]|nr:ATP-dependent protease [Candidatus Acetothermia bacterium]
MARELKPAELRRRCDPKGFGFSTTAELEPLNEIVGQERALESLEVGLQLKDPQNRYNIYVAGEPGLGKTSAVTMYLRKLSAQQPTPPDIVYVYNFQEPHHPRYLLLPPGKGREFKRDMERCIELVKREIPKVLESEEFKAQAKAERERFARLREQAFEELEAKAKELGFAIQRTPIGINTIPLKPDGTPYSQEEYEKLPQEAKEDLLQRQEAVQEAIRETLKRLGELEEEWQKARRELTKRAAQFLLEPHFAQLRAKYGTDPRVSEYLSQVQQDIVENFESLQAANKQPPIPLPQQQDPYQRYRVNVIVDHSATRGAPVVVEENATYTNLFGTIERRVQFGIMTTDFTQIRAGALHRANGGYLVLSAPNLLRSPLSWEALKIALRSGRIRIEDPAQMLGIAPTEGLRPEPIPLDVKVILIGPPWLYYLLHFHDEDFRKFFTIRSDFDTEMAWDQAAEEAIARFVRARQEVDRDVLPFAPSGVAKLVEYAAELAGDQRKISTRFAELSALIKEASFWARREGAATVEAGHVRTAIQKGKFRQSLVAEKIRELIARRKILVDVAGERVGQVNGLAVIDLGDFAFGKPSRITANVYTGKDGVVNIEREAELSGKTHTKGIMILKGYLGDRFAKKRPLSLSASITFEQSYTMIDGDSASAAELLALISALSGVPVKQGIAVTGSVDQKGRIQPVGGINEKIEGHFRACQVLGLTGDQGVINPAGNVDNLMPPEDIVEAVEKGRFHIWAVETVEEVVELATGMPAGTPNEDGDYPEGTVYHLVQKRLDEIGRSLKEEVPAEEED